MEATTNQEGTMQASETHQGHTNYATFGVVVTLENDRSTSEAIHAKIDQLRNLAPSHDNVPSIWTADEALRFTTEDYLKDITETLAERGVRDTGSMAAIVAAQMVQAGLAEVDWADVAASFLNP